MHVLNVLHYLLFHFILGLELIWNNFAKARTTPKAKI
jgi:hypothetical protein